MESVYRGQHQRLSLVPVWQAGHDRVDENGYRAVAEAKKKHIKIDVKDIK
jgi:hypothetical protein